MKNVTLGRKVKVTCLGGGKMPNYETITVVVKGKPTEIDAFYYNGKMYAHAGHEHFNGQVWGLWGREIKTA